MYSNNSAYLQTINTLTEISSKVIEQKFYTIKNIPDFIDIEVGRGGFAEEIMNWATYDVVGDFETGNFGSNADFERTASADITIDKKVFYRQKWKKSLTYNITDLEQAERARVINLVEAKETARKRNFDLGLQKTIFLGSDINPNITGLLNNNEVNVNTTLITKPLSSMTEIEFNNFISLFLNLFFENSDNTVMPNTFVLPTSDYNGLSSQMSPTFPIKTKLQVLEEALSQVVAGYGVNDFKILPVVYANANKNSSGLNIYALYNKDIDTLTYDLPVNYTTTAFNSVNNFDFQNMAYAMYGSVNLLRPKEMMYFTSPATQN
jgi:hypothetical protein